MQLVLSLFPGIDLLGRGFEQAGYCVVRGPDTLWGGDIRTFHTPPNRFEGIIAGTPCQDFSKARRSPPTGYGLEMLREFCRVIAKSQPAWFLLENVPTVPNIAIDGYTIQRLDLDARECGSPQRRLRHFQFGSQTGLILVPTRAAPLPGQSQPTATATEGHKKNRRSWADFCELQGLPRDFNLPGMTKIARYHAVGSGVHIAVALTLARSVTAAQSRTEIVDVCACNCGRRVTPPRTLATPACRKRIQRRRQSHTPPVTVLSTP